MTVINIQTDAVGCRKPGCSHRLERTNRHHRRQESLFIGNYGRNPKRKKDVRYRTLVENYANYRPQDIVVICESHHCEIHLLYDQIIKADIEQRRRAPFDYTWPQAFSLMKKLAAECDDWMQRRTPGVDPSECDPQIRYPRRSRKRGSHR